MTATGSPAAFHVSRTWLPKICASSCSGAAGRVCATATAAPAISIANAGTTDLRRGPRSGERRVMRTMVACGLALGDSVETLNANVERLNRLLFTWLDYAAVGRRP